MQGPAAEERAEALAVIQDHAEAHGVVDDLPPLLAAARLLVVPNFVGK